MGMESGGGRGERSRPQFETANILKHPEQAFDSPLAEAMNSAKEAMKHLQQQNKIDYKGRNLGVRIERDGQASTPSIQIAWPITNTSSHVLSLDPIQERRGPESRVFITYKGVYGIADRASRSQAWKYRSKVSLEELFGVPEGLDIYVQPTIDRWAIERDPMTSALFGENARRLYMGLGFLFLGHQWMHVGMHEAGHLPDVSDENQAWFKANKLYAARHRGIKKAVIAGKNSGQFELLQKPDKSSWNPKPTIGKIVQYGLVSRFIGGTRIPKHWQSQIPEIMEEFKQVIKKAHRAYEDVFVR